MTDAVHTPAGPGAYDVVEIVDLRETPRLHAVVEVVQDPHLLLRLERAIAIPSRAPVRWFDGDTAWQAVSEIDQIDATSVNCLLAPQPEWEPAPVRQSLRAAVSNSPILVKKVVEESSFSTSRPPLHAVCLDISASGCRATWPGPPPAIGERVEIAWEVDDRSSRRGSDLDRGSGRARHRPAVRQAPGRLQVRPRESHAGVARARLAPRVAPGAPAAPREHDPLALISDGAPAGG